MPPACGCKVYSGYYECNHTHDIYEPCDKNICPNGRWVVCNLLYVPITKDNWSGPCNRMKTEEENAKCRQKSRRINGWKCCQCGTATIPKGQDEYTTEEWEAAKKARLYCTKLDCRYELCSNCTDRPGMTARTLRRHYRASS